MCAMYPTLGVTKTTPRRWYTHGVKIEWDGKNFTPESARWGLVLDIRHVGRIPDSATFLLVHCPDCNKYQRFYDGTPYTHEC